MKTQAGFGSTSRVFMAIISLITAFACLTIPGAYAHAGGFSGTLTGTASFDTSKAQFAATGTGSVFVTVKADGKDVAKGLQASVEKDASVLTLEKFNPTKTYTVEFTSSPRGEVTCTGAIAPVYANFGEGDPELIAVHTAVNDDWGQFVAPATRVKDGKLYRLTNAAGNQAADGTLTFDYKLDESVTDLNAVTGTISYVTPAGDVVRTDKLPNFLAGNDVEVPNVIYATVAGETLTFEVIGLKDGETLTISPKSAQTDFIVPVRVLKVNETEGQYNATIKYIDKATGKTLVQDALLVNKVYHYTVPDEFYQYDANGKVQVYRLDASFAENPIELSTKDDPQKTLIEVPYNKVAQDETLTWTIHRLNGADGSNAPIAEDLFFDIQPGGGLIYAAMPLDVNGTTYYPAGVPQGDTKYYSYNYGDDNLVTNVYYVPAGHDPEPYDVTINYVNYADNSLIGSTKMTADPASLEDLQILGPENLTVDGTEYVRLAGQDQAKRHNFYSNQRTYTVYYRDVKDDLLAMTTVYETVIVRTHRVEPGTTIVVRGEGDNAVRYEATSTTLNDNGGTVNAVAGGNQDTAGTFTNNGDPTHARGADIQDDATPLSSGKSQASPITTGLIIAAALIGAGLLILLLVFLKKRKQSNEQDGGIHNA